MLGAWMGSEAKEATRLTLLPEDPYLFRFPAIGRPRDPIYD